MVILLTNCNLTPSVDVGYLYGFSLSVINIFTRRNPHLKLLPKEGKSSVSLHSQYCAPRKDTMSCGDIICQDNFLFVSKYILYGWTVRWLNGRCIRLLDKKQSVVKCRLSPFYVVRLKLALASLH